MQAQTTDGGLIPLLDHEPERLERALDLAIGLDNSIVYRLLCLAIATPDICEDKISLLTKKQLVTIGGQIPTREQYGSHAKIRDRMLVSIFIDSCLYDYRPSFYFDILLPAELNICQPSCLVPFSWNKSGDYTLLSPIEFLATRGKHDLVSNMINWHQRLEALPELRPDHDLPVFLDNIASTRANLDSAHSILATLLYVYTACAPVECYQDSVWQLLTKMPEDDQHILFDTLNKQHQNDAITKLSTLKQPNASGLDTTLFDELYRAGHSRPALILAQHSPGAVKITSDKDVYKYAIELTHTLAGLNDAKRQTCCTDLAALTGLELSDSAWDHQRFLLSICSTKVVEVMQVLECYLSRQECLNVAIVHPSKHNNNWMFLNNINLLAQWCSQNKILNKLQIDARLAESGLALTPSRSLARFSDLLENHDNIQAILEHDLTFKVPLQDLLTDKVRDFFTILRLLPDTINMSTEYRHITLPGLEYYLQMRKPITETRLGSHFMHVFAADAVPTRPKTGITSRMGAVFFDHDDNSEPREGPAAGGGGASS